VVPGGTRSNRLFVSPSTDWGELPRSEQLVLADAQTSGGLLIAVPPERAGALAEALRARRVTGVEIGSVSNGKAGGIRIHNRLAG
jgi:selenide,water dikinase